MANASSALVALLTAVPFGSAAASTLLVARHSQATGERLLHLSLDAQLISQEWLN